MVSLMPAIPLTFTPATPIYEKKRLYTPAELGTFQFDPASLTIARIRSELKYYRDEKEYVGPRTVPNKAEGIRVLLIARSVAGVPAEQRAQAAPANVVGTNTSRQVLPEGATVVRRPGEVRTGSPGRRTTEGLRTKLKPDIMMVELQEHEQSIYQRAAGSTPHNLLPSSVIDPWLDRGRWLSYNVLTQDMQRKWQRKTNNMKNWLTC